VEKLKCVQHANDIQVKFEPVDDQSPLVHERRIIGSDNSQRENDNTTRDVDDRDENGDDRADDNSDDDRADGDGFDVPSSLPTTATTNIPDGSSVSNSSVPPLPMEQANVCPDCGRLVSSKMALKCHRWEQHEVGNADDFFTCEICHKRLSRLTQYNAHKLKKHGVKRDDGSEVRKGLLFFCLLQRTFFKRLLAEFNNSLGKTLIFM
jgi:hypothetical protein